jgi:hypothetical protein
MTEQETAFLALFETILKMSVDFLNEDLNGRVSKMIQDHNQASLNAVEKVLTYKGGKATEIIDCSEHCERKVHIFLSFFILIICILYIDKYYDLFYFVDGRHALHLFVE